LEVDIRKPFLIYGNNFFKIGIASVIFFAELVCYDSSGSDVDVDVVMSVSEHPHVGLFKDGGVFEIGCVERRVFSGEARGEKQSF
jgi:hypothetical protein